MGKDNFIIPLKYKRRFARWSAKQCKAVLLAMFDYKETGAINIPDEYYDAFEAIRDDMDMIEEAYKRKCESNKENGAKGGAPVGNQNARKQPKTSETTQNNPKQANTSETTLKRREDNILKEKYIKRKNNPKLIRGIERNNDAYDEYGVNMKC